MQNIMSCAFLVFLEAGMGTCQFSRHSLSDVSNLWISYQFSPRGISVWILTMSCAGLFECNLDQTAGPAPRL